MGLNRTEGHDMFPNTNTTLHVIDLDGVPDTARQILAWDHDGTPLVAGPERLEAPDWPYVIVGGQRPATAAEIGSGARHLARFKAQARRDAHPQVTR